jgi:hypothetical protein
MYRSSSFIQDGRRLGVDGLDGARSQNGQGLKTMLKRPDKNLLAKNVPKIAQNPSNNDPKFKVGNNLPTAANTGTDVIFAEKFGGKWAF